MTIADELQATIEQMVQRYMDEVYCRVGGEMV
jgi:hypothetical protein